MDRGQRQVLADKLPDLANLATGALVFGQFLGERPPSIRLAIFGLATWVVLVAGGLLLAKGEPQ